MSRLAAKPSRFCLRHLDGKQLPSQQSSCVHHSNRTTAPPASILRLTHIRRSYSVGTDVETEVLHDSRLAQRCDRMLELVDGRLVDN